jgi:hypothetical protein
MFPLTQGSSHIERGSKNQADIVCSRDDSGATTFHKTRKPLTLIHMGNARVHTARATQEKLDVSRFKHTPQPPYRTDLAPSGFFFSVGWKPSLNGENRMGKVNYMKWWMKF